jgi:hypothetical protein
VRELEITCQQRVAVAGGRFPPRQAVFHRLAGAVPGRCGADSRPRNTPFSSRDSREGGFVLWWGRCPATGRNAALGRGQAPGTRLLVAALTRNVVLGLGGGDERREAAPQRRISRRGSRSALSGRRCRLPKIPARRVLPTAPRISDRRGPNKMRWVANLPFLALTASSTSRASCGRAPRAPPAPPERGGACARSPLPLPWCG